MADSSEQSHVTSPWQPAEERGSQRQQKREAVLLAAVRSFNENGFHATSLEQVAVTLNVTKPTIYHYFSSKDEILFECTRRGLERIREVAGRCRPGQTGLERLTSIMRDYAVIMTEDFGKCVTRVGDNELSPESRLKQRAIKREIDATVRSVVEEGIADGSIIDRDVRLLTFTLTGALNWIAKWYEPGGRYTAEAVADECVDTLVHGLAPRDHSPTGAARPEREM